MEKLNVVTDVLEVDEVRRRLPEVRKALQPLMETTRRIKERFRVWQRLSSQGPPDEAEDLRKELDRLDSKWRAAMKNVNAHGAYVKDPEIGLVDFYHWRNGELVFLCWRYDEPELTHWHGLHEGFAGRKPIGD